MKLILIFLITFGSALATSTPSDILVDSKCKYFESADRIDCSDVSSVDEIAAAMADLSQGGRTEFALFTALSNPNLSHLPHGLLGDMKFKSIVIAGNPNLSSMGDILGTSKDSVVSIQLESNHLSYMPRFESSTLERVIVIEDSLLNVASNVFNAVPNLESIVIRDAGEDYSKGLLISPDAFASLPNLKTLFLEDVFFRNQKFTRGSFVFNSNNLELVKLNGPVYSAEAAAFGGFNANSTLQIMFNDPINVESFYEVVKAGAKIEVQGIRPCHCGLSFLKYSCFLAQVNLKCAYWKYWDDLANVPDDTFQNCCFRGQ